MSASEYVELELDYAPGYAPPELAWLAHSPFGVMLELIAQAVHEAQPSAWVADLRFEEPLLWDGARRCVVRVDRVSGLVRVWSTRTVAPHAGDQAPVEHCVARIAGRGASSMQAHPVAPDTRQARPGAAATVATTIGARASALLTAAREGKAERCFDRIAITATGFDATVSASALWDAQYGVHPAVLEEVWHLASAFWAQRGLAGARPLLVRSFRVHERGARIRRIELSETAPYCVQVTLYSARGVAAVFEDVRCDAAGTVARDLPALEQLARRKLREEHAEQPASARAAWLERTIAEVVSEIVGHGDVELSVDTPFRELGLSSINAIAIAVALCNALRIAPSSTLLFDHPTIEQLAAHALSLLHEPHAHAGRPSALPVSSTGVATRAPIAIVGIGCRMPGGVDDVESYWRFLRAGGNAVGPVSASRQALLPGFRGGSWSVAMLEGIERFDARFFDMADTEAIATSPQQRLLLEVAWEALEHAGIVPSTLQGSAASVYVSGSLPEYASILESRDAYFVTGNSPSVLAGRISYALGLQGASVSIDTACSSAAVALCMACDDLRAGTSDFAIAGGANLILDARVLDGLAAASVLSQQGRCAAFDESADGYVRGEACCVIALRTLDEAVRRGERVIAVVREYGIGHGGRSASLAAPRREAIVDLIGGVLRRAAIDPRDVGYVEAHGTGTRVGDAIELEVLSQTYGAGAARSAPIWVGSAKTNGGHTESAAGLVGVIKAALALERREIPAHLHFENPSASFDWANGGLAVPVAPHPWPKTLGRPHLAAVNSFGISGTYAHVILEEPPEAMRVEEAHASDSEACLVPVSARSASSLRALAAAYASHLRSGGTVAALAKTAAVHREALPLRAAVVGRSAASVAERLDAIAQREPQAGPRKPIVAFLFPGQGVQAAGVGQELYASQPAFRDAFDECAAVALGAAGLRLHELLRANTGDEVLSTDLAQPLIFSLELAMTRLLECWGIIPNYVLGHSLGEYVAACVAGAFDVADALRLVIERGRLMQALAPRGAMLAIEAAPDALAELLHEIADRVEIASINAPNQYTLSGAPAAIDVCREAATRRGLKTQKLRVDQAFHSRLMDPVLDAFERAAAQTVARAVPDKLISNVSGGFAGTEICEARYWRDHVRKPVQLMQAVRTLVARGANVFVEVGPRSALLATAARCTEAECHWLPTLYSKGRASEPELDQMLEACAKLFELGTPISLPKVVEALPRTRNAGFADIPLYAFDRKRFWPSGAALAPSARSQAPSIEYELTWVPHPIAARVAESSQSGRWLVVGGSSPIALALSEALALHGERVTCTLINDADASMSGDCHVVCLLDRGDDASEVDAVIRSCATAAKWARAAREAGPGTKLAFVTQGAQQVVNEVRDAHASALASFSRAVAVEHPTTWQGLFDLPAQPTPRDVRALCAALLSDDGEDECAIRRGQRFVGRIVPAVEPLARGAFPVRADAVYCITGGFGHIGLLVARWLVQSGARHVCLLARSGADDSTRAAALRELRALGATVSVVAVNVADGKALREALQRIERPIAAIFHAAGVPGDTVIDELDESSIARVVRGKAEGGRTLCVLADELGIEHVVLFSSLASVLAGAGQAPYAAANGYLNALAASARIRGQRVQSMLWGPWAGGGMGEVGGLGTWAAGGLTPIQPSVGLAALARALAAGVDQRIVVDVDWTSLRALFELSRACPIFGDLGLAHESDPQGSDLVRTLLRLNDDERARALRAFLSAEIASVAGDREVWHEPDADIMEVTGLDSLAIVQLRGRIRASLGLRIDNALFLEHRSVSALATVLDELLRKRWTAAP